MRVKVFNLDNDTCRSTDIDNAIVRGKLCTYLKKTLIIVIKIIK